MRVYNQEMILIMVIVSAIEDTRAVRHSKKAGGTEGFLALV